MKKLSTTCRQAQIINLQLWPEFVIVKQLSLMKNVIFWRWVYFSSSFSQIKALRFMWNEAVNDRQYKVKKVKGNLHRYPLTLPFPQRGASEGKHCPELHDRLDTRTARSSSLRTRRESLRRCQQDNMTSKGGWSIAHRDETRGQGSYKPCAFLRWIAEI